MKYLLLFLFIFTGLSFSETTKIIKNKNDFDGKTYETIFSKGDNFFEKLKIYKALTHYDYKNEIVMVEYFFTKDFVDQKNYDRKIEYYGKNKKVNKAEFFYTKKYADEKGLYKVIDIISENGEVVQVLFFYTDRFVSKYGFSNCIMYLAKGYITKIEYNYTDDFAKKYGYKVREDQYVYDAEGNRKVIATILYSNDGKEVNRIENPKDIFEPER